MKSTFSLILLIATCFLFSTCGRSPAARTASYATDGEAFELSFPVTIDIASVMSNFSENNILSDLIYDIEYVQLETTDESLIRRGFVTVTDDYIFIICRRIFMFSRTGEFLRAIGQPGQGPRSFGPVMMPPEIDIVNRVIYIPVWGANRYRKFDFEGNYLGTITLSIRDEFGQIFALEDGSLFINFAVMFPFWDRYKLGWHFSPEGELLHIHPSHIVPESERITSMREAARLSMPYIGGHIWYRYQNKVMINEPLNDTVFTITPAGLVPRFILDFGRYKPPLSVMTNQRSRFNQNYAWIFPWGMMETCRFFIIQFIHNRRGFTGVFDKTLGTFSLRASTRLPEDRANFTFYDFLINDFDGGLSTSLPQSGASMTHPYRLIDELTPEHFARMRGRVKHSERMEALQRLVNNLDEEDNPVVRIFHFKR